MRRFVVPLVVTALAGVLALASPASADRVTEREYKRVQVGDSLSRVERDFGHGRVVSRAPIGVVLAGFDTMIGPTMTKRYRVKHPCRGGKVIVTYIKLGRWRLATKDDNFPSRPCLEPRRP